MKSIGIPLEMYVWEFSLEEVTSSKRVKSNCSHVQVICTCMYTLANSHIIGVRKDLLVVMQLQIRKANGHLDVLIMAMLHILKISHAEIEGFKLSSSRRELMLEIA